VDGHPVNIDTNDIGDARLLVQGTTERHDIGQQADKPNVDILHTARPME